MTDRNFIKVKIEDYSIYDFFNNSIEDVLQKLEDMKDDLSSKGYSCLEFKVEYCYEATQICLYGTRLENDKELKERLASEEREKKILEKLEHKKKKEELAMYKRLQKKYGDIK